MKNEGKENINLNIKEEDGEDSLDEMIKKVDYLPQVFEMKTTD